MSRPARRLPSPAPAARPPAAATSAAFPLAPCTAAAAGVAEAAPAVAPTAVPGAGQRGAGRRRAVSLDALARAEPACAAVLAPLGALVEEALRLGLSRVHAEASATGLGLRLRDRTGLDTRRVPLDGLDPVTALETALDALAGAGSGAADTGTARTRARCVGLRAGPVHLVLELASGRAFATLERLRGPHLSSAVLAVAPHPPVAPGLDALVDDARALEALRGALDARDGLVLVVDPDPVAGLALGEAVAQSLVGPDRKVVHASAVARHPLAGVLQVERAGASARAVLGQDADALVVDASVPGLASSAALRRASAHALVVRTLRADGVAGALDALRAEGASPARLADRLRAIARVQRVRLLCEGCRGPDDADGPMPEAAADAPFRDSPARRLLAASLGRGARAPGCARCAGTGIERARTLIDVHGLGPEDRAALGRDDPGALARALEARRRTPALVRAELRRGRVSAEEASRFGIG